MNHSRGRGSRVIAAFLAAVCLAAPAAAGITVYEQDDKKIEIGARIQIQYARIDPDDGDAFDKIFFRRLRPYIAGTIYKNWMGKIAFDFGESLDAEEVAIRDAYMRYTGLPGNKMYIGNSKAPFSREFLTSSKRLDLISRSFAGDHNFGTPDRLLGYRNDGGSAKELVTYSVAAGGQQHAPDMHRMDFDTPVNNQADWNDGALAVGRVDFNPRGLVKFSQADFRTDEWKYAVGASNSHRRHRPIHGTTRHYAGRVSNAPRRALLSVRAVGRHVYRSIRSGDRRRAEPWPRKLRAVQSRWRLLKRCWRG